VRSVGVEDGAKNRRFPHHFWCICADDSPLAARENVVRNAIEPYRDLCYFLTML
jgi:hypothetical protein